MTVGLALGIIGGYASNMLIGIGQTKRLMKYQIATVIIDLVVLFLLVPVMGAYGAIASVFFADTLFGTIIYARIMRKDFGIRTHVDELARMAAASIVILVVMYAITALSGQEIYAIVIDIVVALLLYPPLLAAFGALDMERIEFLREAGRSMGGISYLVDKMTAYAAIFTRKD
jgi:O-antigen/teichoic acid export membrane protein